MTELKAVPAATPAPADYMSLDEMLDVDDIAYADVVVPQWAKNGKSGKVRIGSLTADDMMDWLEANDGPAKRTAGLRLIAKSLVDKDGKRVGGDTAVVKLASRNTQAINLLVTAVLELNGLKKDAGKDAKNDSSEANTGASPTT